MKGEAQLWRILNDKLETLRAGQQFVEALRVAERALELARRSFPAGDPSLGASYEKVGRILDQQGRRAEAKEPLRQALAIAEDGQAPDLVAIYRRARRLANLCDLLGQPGEAIDFYERAIRAGSQLPQARHRDLGTLLNNVALIYRRSGRAREAEPYYLQALALYEKQLGPDHADVAAVLNNLGVFYTNERRFTEAEQTHQRALEIRRRAYPAGHPDVAQSICNLAVVYHSWGDYEQAEELYRRSLDVWEKLAANPAGDYEIVVSNYADLLRSLGKERRAAALETRARKKRAQSASTG